MEKQMNPFQGGQHHDGGGNSNDDEDEALQKHDGKKKGKAMTLGDVSETYACNLKAVSTSTFKPASVEDLTHQTSIQHDSEPSDAAVDDTSDTLPIVDLSSTQKAQLGAQFKHSLFAKVLGKKVGDQKLSTHVRRLWSLEGTLDIVPLENDFFLLKFSLASDYNKVLEGVPWLIDDHYITLHPWVPNFKPSEAVITKAAVWIRLPELPIEYYDKGVLLQIGAAIGDLVRIDSVTERQTKGRFARLCIEVNLNRPLPPQIKLGGLCQRIEYEGLHVLCYQCGRVGHLQQDCPYIPPVIPSLTHHHLSSQAIPVVSVPHETPNTSQNLTSSTSSSIYGPWLQVPPRRRQHSRYLAKDSGQQQPQVQGHNFAIKSEPEQLGSRFRVLEDFVDLTDEPKAPKEKYETSVSISSSPHIKMNVGPRPNNTLEQNRHLQPGEGTSSPAKDIETSTDTEDMVLASTKSPKPKETSTSQFGTSLKQELPPGFSASKPSNLPPDIPQPLQTHQTNSPPLSPTVSNSNVSPSSTSNSQPTQHQLVSPFPPTALVTSSITTDHSYQPADSVKTNQLHTASTFLHLNQPQPSATAIEFYSQGVQRSIKQLEINSTPELKELSTEGSPTVFSIESKISNIDIGVNILQLSNGMANRHKISLIPTVVDHTMYPALQSYPNKLLSWNCRGAGGAMLMRALKDLCQLHQPSIVLLFETRISGTDADHIIKDIGFSGSYYVDPVGLTSGIWLLWCKEYVHIEVSSTSSQQIHVAAHFLPEPYDWMRYTLYTGSEHHNWRRYGVDSDSEPLSQPRSPEFFYDSDQLTIPQTSQWVSSY